MCHKKKKLKNTCSNYSECNVNIVILYCSVRIKIIINITGKRKRANHTGRNKIDFPNILRTKGIVDN